jgi:hypothetical protein
MIHTCLWIKQELSQQEDRQLCLEWLCQKILKFQNKIKFHSYLPTLFFGHVIGNKQFFFFLALCTWFESRIDQWMNVQFAPKTTTSLLVSIYYRTNGLPTLKFGWHTIRPYVKFVVYKYLGVLVL